jgi:hypothetical protein
MTGPRRPPTAKRRRMRRTGTVAIAALSVVAVYALPANAVHDDNLFELDRNAVSVTTTPVENGDDWDKVFAGTSGADTARFITDDNRIYTGGSTKDDLDLPGWRHTVGSVPDKDELLHGYAARYDDNLYFGADRFANNGDAQIGVWFFQTAVGPITTGVDAGKFSGTHKDGDVLVLSDFTKGGETSTVRVFRWNGPGGTIAGSGAIDGTLDIIGGQYTNPQPADCVGSTTTPGVANGDPFCATVNATATGSPWPFTPKTGPAGTFQKGEFYEGGIDLAALNLGDECFSSFILETRSSQSVDAVLKDFVAGGFESCGANISIAPDAVNAVNDPHTFTVTVTKKVGSTTTGVSGVKPTVTLTTSNGATLTNVDKSDCETTGTDANGQCDVIFSSSSAGVVTGHATATVVIDGTNFPVATDGSAGNTGDAVKRFVDAKLSLSPLSDTNGITEDHVVTATVSQDDGLAANATGGDSVTGFGTAGVPNGTTVTFSLPAADNTAGAVFKNGVSTCTTTSGSCSITITSNTAGSVNIHATTTFSVGGINLTRATGPGVGTNAGDDATKTFVDGTLRWLKHDQDGNLLGGAKFSVCRTHTWSSETSTYVDTADVCLGSGTPAKIDDDVVAPVGTGANADNDATPGEFELSTLVLGRYVITETDAPAGYALDPTPQSVDLSVTNPSNADGSPAIPVFVNEQLFKLIVLTCNQSLNTLADSEVSLSGKPTTDTLTSVPAALAAKGVTEADLCALGGAAYGSLAAGTYAPSVELPDVAPLHP